MNAKAKIAARIRGFKPGHAFTAKDFLDLASRGLVDVVLSKLAKEGTIRRLVRGLYDLPQENRFLGVVLSPDADQVARAVARRFRWHILPDGATAANALGLSTQVPARIAYLSDGPTRTIRLGRQEIHFKHASPKEMQTGDSKSSMVVQALRHLGKGAITPRMLDHLRATLSKQERRRLLRHTRYTADWIFEAATHLADEEEE